jgi:phosphopantothenoylcysteine decarboxylase / phosphopantothenate---cysteine ligase
MDLRGRKITLGITGGIAAYKSCELLRRMQDQGAAVQVVMTRGAQQFVTATTFQALAGRPVFVDQWGQDGASVANAMPHIDLTRGTDALLVAPASAHFIARVAQGLADDLLSTLAVGRACPLLLTPAMNVEMWNNSATQRNVEMLKRDGAQFFGPAVGDQACGETGAGRMLEPHEILAELIASFQPKSLRDRRVLVTAGPTFEPIDPVRGITNLSSGKMGFAIARAAREAGAEVTLVAGPTALATPYGVRRIDVLTAQQMYDATLSAVSAAELFIAVAAVADWRVANVNSTKLKKSQSQRPPVLEFAANPDILASVAALPDAPYCVGFAAETHDVLAHAQAKRQAKRVPMLVANRAQDALGADQTALTVLDDAGSTDLPAAEKLVQARKLVAMIGARLTERRRI